MRVALRVVLIAALVSVLIGPGRAAADGILDAISGNEEGIFSLLSTKTTDATGTTTKIDTVNYGVRSNWSLNYFLLPKVNLTAGSVYEKEISDVLKGPVTGETDITRFRPWFWLTLRDPVLGGAVGYALVDDTLKTPGQRETALTRETYAANATWQPTGLPYTQARYTHTVTRDDPRVSLDMLQDEVYVKSEYLYRGLDAYYSVTYRDSRDNIRDTETQELSHEGKVLYASSFFDNRVFVTSDNRVRITDLTSDATIAATGPDTFTALSLPARAGLSVSPDVTPLSVRLDQNPALIDNDVATSSGINIGFPGPGGDLRPRSVGLDLGTALAVNRLEVWVTFGTTLSGPQQLTSDITAVLSNGFSWDVYTSTDNFTWTFYTTIPTAPFGPFDQRFEVSFPSVTTRYIKVVTRPLSTNPALTNPAISNPTIFTSIAISELRGFSDNTAQPGTTKRHTTLTQTSRSHNLDVRVNLLNIPSLYYRFNGEYQEFEPGTQPRYTISNGLFLNHRLSPIFSVSANGSFEVGRDQDKDRKAALYYAALTATPLKTLTDTLVFSGNEQWLGKTTTTNNSVVLYNTAQLYKGIDGILQLGGVLTSTEEPGVSSQRRDLYVNAGTTITPHRSFTLTAYYLGKVSHASGTNAGPNPDTTETRVDVNAVFSPFRSLYVSAAANILSETGQATSFTNNYGVNWTPFPDGALQFSFFFAETHLPDNSTTRIVQPTLRWYIGTRRRSYLEATYALNTNESTVQKTESRLFSLRLNVYY